MLKVNDILEKLSDITFIGNDQQEVSHPIILDAKNEDPRAIMWVNNKNLDVLSELKYGTVICSNEAEVYTSTLNIIKTENPRNVFRQVLELFFSEKRTPAIAKSAIIATNAKIGSAVFIGENVVIEDNCIIGNNTEIGHNTVILKGTVIGNDVVIGCNCTIGGVGFGYEKDQDGSYVLIPHLGNVVLKDAVNIGNNTTIDRAVLGSTLLQENVKVDNLVHIAHGVDVGKNSLVIANAMVAGSVQIGENVWVAPSASILNKIKIADNALVGIGAVVLKNVSESDVVVGNPAKSIKKI